MPTKPTPQFTAKQLIEIEYHRCETDPVYFINKYVYIQAEDGRMLFSTFDFQSKLVNLFKTDKYKRISILKSRQIGITTLCAAYALWYILFHADKSIMCLAPTQEKAKIILNKVKFGYENLPSWIRKRHPFSKKNELSFTLKNGSSIAAASGDSDSARGFTAHILFLDEAAFIDNAEDLWGSAQATLDTTDGMAVILSTPNGVGGWFWKKHTEAKEKTPQDEYERKKMFIPVELPWTVHPKRDQRWRDYQTSELGERLAKQECDCNFAASGDTVISPDIIEWYDKTHKCSPIEMRGPLADIWIFKYPVPGSAYALICDVARGDGSDYSTVDIYDIYSCEQVAEYKGQPDTDDFPKIILQLGYEYNEGLVVIERESIGWAVVKDAVSSKYQNLYYSPKEGMVMDAETYLQRNYDNDISKMVPGFSTNVKYRPLVINSFVNMVEKKVLIVHSERSINEWRSFIWGKDGKARAQKGSNDDLTIPKGIFGFLRDTAIRFSQEGKTISNAMLSNFVMKTGSTNNNTIPSNIVSNTHRRSSDDIEPKIIKPKVNPYIMRIGNRQEDCSWLI
jgi:hypothetical protein